MEDSVLDRPASESRDDAARQAATCLPVVAPPAALRNTSRPPRLAEAASIAVLSLLLTQYLPRSLSLDLLLPLQVYAFSLTTLCQNNSAATLVVCLA